MKKISYLLGCALAAFFLVSCVDDGPVENGSGAGASGSTVLTASIEDLVLTSKVVITPDEGGEPALQSETEEANAHVWVKTDKLGVFGSESGNNAKYTLFNESVDRSEGRFYGPEVVGDVYAYYPWVEGATSEGSQLSLSFPSEQKYNADVKTQFAQNTTVFVAKAVDGTLEFKHPMGCFGIGIKGDVDIYSVTLTSKSKPLSGTLGLDFENDFAVTTVNNSSRTVKLVLEEPVHVDMYEPTLFYVMLPPATYDDLAISIDTNEGTFGKVLIGEYQVERLSMTDFDGTVGNATIAAEFELLSLNEEQDSAVKSWNEGDIMGIFAGDAVNSKYTLMRGEAGKTEGTFKGIESTGDVVAYYPYSDDATLDGSKLTLSVPTTQTYYADLFTHFKSNTPFVVGKAAEGEKLMFEYVTGVVAVKVKANCTVKSVAVSSVNKAIAGNMVVDLDNDYAITPATSGTRSIISLDCGSGIATTEDAPQTFYVLLPPASYNGLAVRVTTAEGDTLVANLDSTVDIEPLKTTDFAKDVAYVTVTVTMDESLLANKSNPQTWSADDTVLVYDSTTGTTKQGVLLSGAGTSTGQFKIVGAAETDVYEWVAKGPSMAVLQGNLTFDYRYNSPMVGAEKAYGTAVGAAFGRNSAGKFALKNLMGCMAIRVKGTGTLRSVTVKNGKTPISSDSKLAVEIASASQATPVTSIMKNSMEPTYIYIGAEAGVTLSSSEYTTIYVDVPAGIEWNALQIGLMADEWSYVKSLGALSVNANAAPVKVLDVDIASVANSASGATALDKDETYSNSYIVEPNGANAYYSFELKHVDGTALSNDQMAGAVWAYAQTAWTSAHDLIDDVYLNRADNRVYFRYDGLKKGNAKLAITNDAYRVGWTYHIWCTDRPKDVIMEGSSEAGVITRYPWMDRNVGATYAPRTIAECRNITQENAEAACGFIFQYGNPNGYPSSIGMTSENKNETVNFANREHIIVYGFDQYVSGSFKSSNSLKASADGAISYPNYIFAKSDNASVAHWYNGSIECYGTMTTDARCLWWTTNSDPYQIKPSQKSNYDPCPYGYCIPNQGMIYRSLQCAHAFNESKGHEYVTTRYYTSVFNGDVAYGQYCLNEDGDAVYWFANGGYGTAMNRNFGVSSYIYASRNGSGQWATLDGPAYMVCGSKEGENAATASFKVTIDSKGVPLTTGYGVRCIRQMKEE